MMLPFVLILFAVTTSARGCSKEIDIAVVTDTTGNIPEDDVESIRAKLSHIVWSATMGDMNVKWAHVQVSSSVSLKMSMPAGTVGLPTLKYKKALEFLSNDGAQSFPHNTLDQASDSFRRGRDGAHKLVLLISDGNFISGSNTKAKAEILKRDGVRIFSIGVGPALNMSGLDEISSPGMSFSATDDGGLSSSKLNTAFEKFKSQVADWCKCVYTVGSTTCPCSIEGSVKVNGTCQEQYNSNCSQMPKDPPRVIVQLAGGLDVMCDMVTDGGGWLVFQRRTSGAVDFYRNWTEYKNGFGNHENFWLGNQRIHQITSKRPYELRVDLQYKGKSYFAQYDAFSIESEQKSYRLRLGAFSSKSNATDDLRWHNGEAFTTFDRDNDINFHINCAVISHGAWWHYSCANSNLNGHWGNKTNAQGPYWQQLTGENDVVTFSEMKIRPIDQD